ncbi:alpha/beta hydrolase [Sphingobium yanoikuyae]|uniref:alpha/beta hydrolase n=1 Tax=Sphingobium yanoikuyae TaxID=13690 RepID=UPI0028A614E5|nr:alpha/beta hydrolase [Sphingobium yanoikuyae]
MTNDVATPHGVLLEGQIVPFPGSISAEAQAALRRLVREDGMPVNALYPMPAVEDHDGWMRVKAGANAHYAASVGRLARTLRSSVATIELGDATIHVAQPERPIHADCAIIDLHGGALIVGGGDACRIGTQMQADRHGVTCYGVDYRMPPEHPYPAALDDCIAVYRHILESHAPEHIIIHGRSAGGNLAVASLLRARDEGLVLPAALVLLSPEVDLTESGDSFQTNRMIDVVLPGSLMANNLLYAAGADLADPLLSPLFGNLTGFPPTFIQSGTRDLFLSNAVRLHRRLRAESVEAYLHVFEGMPHGGFGGGTTEDQELEAEVALFVRSNWPDPASEGIQ